jgi:hypothetical protein
VGRLNPRPISSRSRYDHFGTSPVLGYSFALTVCFGIAGFCFKTSADTFPCAIWSAKLPGGNNDGCFFERPPATAGIAMERAPKKYLWV